MMPDTFVDMGIDEKIGDTTLNVLKSTTNTAMAIISITINLIF